MKRIIIPAVALILTGVVWILIERIQPPMFFTRSPTLSDNWFAEHPLPAMESHRLFDLGIVDANGDGFLDIYTSLHNYQQTLLVSNKRGRYNNMLSEWGLDQDEAFPELEISSTAPSFDRAGLYIYWLNDNLILRTYKTAELGSAAGALHSYSKIKVEKNSGFNIVTHDSRPIPGTEIQETTLEFSAKNDALLILKPDTDAQDIPRDFHLTGSLPLRHVYVGRKKTSPHTGNFSLKLQDRHALAWSDWNDDGLPDIFISRGGLNGFIKQYSENTPIALNYEFFVSKKIGQYENLAKPTGLAIQSCSARHARWADFNQDGLLDLFINCQDRGIIKGEYPKQAYQQGSSKHFLDRAKEIGLDIPDHQLIDFSWFDANHDGYPDLLASQENGFFLYRNEFGRFTNEPISDEAKNISTKVDHKYTVNTYWRFDGKLTVTDYDNDGDLDIFSASKKGNVLLVNDGTTFRTVDPTSIGLPSKSVAANWVDYDNDGLQDLFTVPDGLIHQNKNHTFSRVNLLTCTPGKYQAAIVNWFDMNNDGKMDLLIALNENPSSKSGWRKIFLPTKDPDGWKLSLIQNTGAINHWLQIKLVGAPGNREAIGARVSVETSDGRQTQELGSSEGSFFSQGHYRLYFGLGSHTKANAVTIRWPDGTTQTLRNVAGDSLLTVKHDSQDKKGTTQ